MNSVPQSEAKLLLFEILLNSGYVRLPKMAIKLFTQLYLHRTFVWCLIKIYWKVLVPPDHFRFSQKVIFYHSTTLTICLSVPAWRFIYINYDKVILRLSLHMYVCLLYHICLCISNVERSIYWILKL